METSTAAQDYLMVSIVTAGVRSRGILADLWHSGGGIMVVSVPLQSGGRLNWGVANDFWGADIEAADGEFIGSINLTVKTNEESLQEAIAQICQISQTLGAVRAPAAGVPGINPPGKE